MTTYKEVTNDLGLVCIEKIEDDGKIWIVPTDPANSDYQRYLRWVENPEAEEFTLRLAEQPTCATKIAWYNANRLTLPRPRGHYE